MNLTGRSFVAATDFSTAAGYAVDRAAALAREHGLPLELWHALDEGDWLERLGELTHGHLNLERLQRSAQARLDAEAARLREGASFPLEVHVVVGALAPSLEEGPFDAPPLVVIGSSGEGGFREGLLGSTADRLLRGGRFPVLLCRRPPTAWSRVALALDFSAASMGAAELGMLVAPRASHYLVHASRPVPDRAMALANARDETRKAFEDTELARAAERLGEAARALGPKASQAARVTRLGAPGPALAKFVEEAGIDLVVLGARARSRWEAHLLGSTALFASQRLGCDVLLVPEPAASRPE